jgi:hypothetical protein
MIYEGGHRAGHHSAAQPFGNPLAAFLVTAFLLILEQWIGAAIGRRFGLDMARWFRSPDPCACRGVAAFFVHRPPRTQTIHAMSTAIASGQGRTMP